MSNDTGPAETGTPAIAEELLTDQQKRWARKPFEFLRRLPSHPDGPISYYRERNGITFLLHLEPERVSESEVTLRLTAENQPGCLAFMRRPETRSLSFTISRPN